ncbi:hypothetical protein HOLleu_15893 [Holothuria leucospilota]|uniref:Uncharacterized protein n=1 Tax=Holothuria leucospilota TaxID=206669 RepID=A0A9Q1H9Z0_HOLLE|nr:hypothetical protein HOLleu_15893 [Holothuria leucospilota]
MAREGKGTPDVSPLLFTAPPYTEKGGNSANNQTKFKILGAITIIAIVVAGIVSVTHLLFHPSSSEGSRLDGSKEDLIFGGHRKEFLLEFTLGGKSHKELIQVDEDQKLVIISDVDAGFSVTLDYYMGIAIIKNTSSSDCFFTRVEHISVYRTNKIKTIRPIVVQEVRNFSSPWSSDNTETITLLRSNVIPPEYLQLTSNQRISKQCIDSASYWLEGKPPPHRQRRKMSEDFVTWLEGIPPSRRKEGKMAYDFVTWIPIATQHPPEA